MIALRTLPLFPTHRPSQRRHLHVKHLLPACPQRLGQLLCSLGFQATIALMVRPRLPMPHLTRPVLPLVKLAWRPQPDQPWCNLDVQAMIVHKILSLNQCRCRIILLIERSRRDIIVRVVMLRPPTPVATQIEQTVETG